jgi:hypothetical protein
MDVLQVNSGETLVTGFALRPTDPAPPAYASYEERADWSERYVSWFLTQSAPHGALPADVDPSHRYQVEFNSCVLDPQAYERHTHAELPPQTVH